MKPNGAIPVATTLFVRPPADEDSFPGTSRRRSVRGHRKCFYPSCSSAVSDAWVALPDFDDVAVRIADVAARFAVLGLWLRDEFRAPASP
jgi:hypothetical protein